MPKKRSAFYGRFFVSEKNYRNLCRFANLFAADGWFLIYVLKDLLESGRLQPPAEEQKKSLMTVVAPVGE